MHRLLHLVEVDPLNDPGQSEAMIAVKMRQCNVTDRRCAHVGIRHLALRSFAGVEQNAVILPTQKIAVMIALSRRNLSCRAENDEFFHGLPFDAHPPRAGANA